MKKILCTVLLAGVFSGFAQNGEEKVVLTLDDCLKMALENNIQIKRAKNNELIAASNKVQSLMNFLPNLNASINYDFQFGTFFDASADRIVTQRNSSTPGLAANWNIFTGMSNVNQRKRRNHELIAARENVEASRVSTSANILQLYLNVVLGLENVKVGEQRVDLLTAQLERSEKRASVGVVSMEEVYNFRSQLANENLNLQNLRNTYERNKLLLLQAMLLNPLDADYEFQTITADDAVLLDDTAPFDQVLKEGVSASPQIRSAKASLYAFEYQLKAAKGAYLPSVSVFGSIGSRFSSNGAFNPDRILLDNDGNPMGFAFESDATYLEQMRYNQGEYLNLTLNIPVFNRFSTNNRVQLAKIGMINSELAVLQSEIDVTNTIQQTYLDLLAAQKTYQSATENLLALRQSFDFMEKRFKTGNTDFYTYLESLNNKNRAEVQLANAKYSIILRRRILDLYRGVQ